MREKSPPRPEQPNSRNERRESRRTTQDRKFEPKIPTIIKRMDLRKYPWRPLAIEKKLLIPLSILAVVLSGGAYAFMSVNVTTTVDIGEPLRIVTVEGGGYLSGLTCRPITSLTATCSLDAFAGESGTISIVVHNAGKEALSVTPGGASDNTDLTLTIPSVGTISGGGDLTFVYDVVISPGATPGTATLTMTFSR